MQPSCARNMLEGTRVLWFGVDLWGIQRQTTHFRVSRLQILADSASGSNQTRALRRQVPKISGHAGAVVRVVRALFGFARSGRLGSATREILRGIPGHRKTCREFVWSRCAERTDALGILWYFPDPTSSSSSSSSSSSISAFPGSFE